MIAGSAWVLAEAVVKLRRDNERWRRRFYSQRARAELWRYRYMRDDGRRVLSRAMRERGD